MEKYLTVARVLKPQGIRGEIKVMTLTDSAEDLCGFSRLFIAGEEYKVLNVRAFGDTAFLTLKGIADRNAAELLRGNDVLALREDAPPLPDGRFYIVDLIGCKVVDDKGETLGTICDVTPAKTDIYVVDTGAKQVPFVAAEGVILSVDVEGSVITVNRERFNQVALLD
ncbi:MAG: ribosome maturation factor RimM [Candidatus Coproplasma sp.]